MAMERIAAEFRIGRPNPQRAVVAEVAGGDVGLRLIVGHRLGIADLRHQPRVELFRRRIVIDVDDYVVDSRAHNGHLSQAFDDARQLRLDRAIEPVSIVPVDPLDVRRRGIIFSLG